MSDFKAKMHKFAFCRGVGGALTPYLLTVFTRPTTKVRRGRRERGEEKKGEKWKVKGKRREKRWKDLAHPKISAWCTLCSNGMSNCQSLRLRLTAP